MSAAFSVPVRVYWEDTDAGGIVFYANYLKFFERARTEWLRAAGVEQQRLRDETGLMFVVAETRLRYLAPARLDDLLTLTANPGPPGVPASSCGNARCAATRCWPRARSASAACAPPTSNPNACPTPSNRPSRP